MSAVTRLQFIPGTRAIDIGGGIFYRPIRSWHSGTYAGERLTEVNGDRSGCMLGELRGLKVCMPPETVTHRVYWRANAPEDYVSAFLSYPDRMGCSEGKYFWETNAGGDIHRFDTEEECEAFIRNCLMERAG